MSTAGLTAGLTVVDDVPGALLVTRYKLRDDKFEPAGEFATIVAPRPRSARSSAPRDRR